MRRATLAVVMGLGERPEGNCLGLRPIVENLATVYPLDLLFLSYKLSTPHVVAAITSFPPAPRILSGHSLGAGQAHDAARELQAIGEDVAALGMWEPVPEDDAYNGNYKFAPLPTIRNQIAMRVDGPFPYAWGREFSDESLNIRIRPWKFSLFPFFVCHAEMCQRPEVADWYAETLKAICDWHDLPPDPEPV